MDHILLMGPGFLLALAISQLCIQDRNETNNILCLLCLVVFAWLTHGVGFKLGMLVVFPHLNKIHVPFLAATGPLWYFYVRAVLTGRATTSNDRLHMLPVLVSTVLLVPFFLESETFKRDYVEVDIHGFVWLLAYVATRTAELATIAYLLLTIWLLQPERAIARAALPTRFNHIMLVLTAMGLIAAMARLFGSVAGNHVVSVSVPIAIILTSTVGFYCLSHRHSWLVSVGLKAPRIASTNPQASDRLENYRERLRINQWYLDPNLKIQQLARRLGVPAHDLSELINREGGGNFNHFVNALRIEHAKTQLCKYADKPVLDIALASGFNSASAFYAQFSRFESMPPATYRRRVHSELENRSELTSWGASD